MEWREIGKDRIIGGKWQGEMHEEKMKKTSKQEKGGKLCVERGKMLM